MKATLTLISVLIFQTCLTNGTKPIDRDEQIWSPTEKVQEGLKKPILQQAAFGV